MINLALDIYLQLADFAKAESLLERIASLNPNHFAKLKFVARELFYLGAIKKSLYTITRALGFFSNTSS